MVSNMSHIFCFIKKQFSIIILGSVSSDLSFYKHDAQYVTDIYISDKAGFRIAITYEPLSYKQRYVHLFHIYDEQN